MFFFGSHETARATLLSPCWQNQNKNRPDFRSDVLWAKPDRRKCDRLSSNLVVVTADQSTNMCNWFVWSLYFFCSQKICTKLWTIVVPNKKSLNADNHPRRYLPSCTRGLRYITEIVTSHSRCVTLQSFQTISARFDKAACSRYVSRTCFVDSFQ